MHHATVHATYPRDEAVSIVLRGPIAKPAGKIVDQASGKMVPWVSNDSDTRERVAKRRMPAEHFEELLVSLSDTLRT